MYLAFQQLMKLPRRIDEFLMPSSLLPQGGKLADYDPNKMAKEEEELHYEFWRTAARIYKIDHDSIFYDGLMEDAVERMNKATLAWHEGQELCRLRLMTRFPQPFCRLVKARIINEACGEPAIKSPTLRQVLEVFKKEKGIRYALDGGTTLVLENRAERAVWIEWDPNTNTFVKKSKVA